MSEKKNIDWMLFLEDCLFNRELALLNQQEDKENINWIDEELATGQFNGLDLAIFLMAFKLWSVK